MTYGWTAITTPRFVGPPSSPASSPTGHLVQDTAWDGYEQVPAWIVEGYQTMLEELDTQLEEPPDLVAVPAGVGSLAEAVVRHYRRPDAAHPSVLSVEPDTAACVLTSLTADRPVTVATAATVMARRVGWDGPPEHDDLLDRNVSDRDGSLRVVIHSRVPIAAGQGAVSGRVPASSGPSSVVKPPVSVPNVQFWPDAGY